MRTNATSNWLRRIGPLVLLSLWTSSAVSAQTAERTEPSLETTLRHGMTVWITDFAGREEKTRIVAVSGDTVTATAGEETRRLSTTDIMRVQVRHSDSLLNGALIGAGAAIASGLFLCTRMEPWENCRDDVGPIVRIGALGAGIGIGIDGLIHGRRTIYQAGPRPTRLHVAPIVAREARGLQVSLTF